MRRLLMLMTALTLMLTLALADTTEDIGIPADCLPSAEATDVKTALDAQQVIDMTLQALAAHHPSDGLLITLPYAARATLVQLTDGRGAWVGSVFMQQAETPVEAVLTLDSATAAVLRYEENDTGWFSEAQARWEAVLGRYGAWPLEKQVLFDQLYCAEVTHAVPPEGCISLESACDLALEASGLTASRDTLHFERTLVHDQYTGRYVWMITVCLKEQELAQVILDAMRGEVVAVFDFREDVG